MGFALHPIFITNQASVSNEELLDRLGFTELVKWRAVDFYDTSKTWNTVFVGSKDDCKIICSDVLCEQAFEEDGPLMWFEESEITAIYWNETVDMYGFCLIKNGNVVRKALAIGREITHDKGQPVPEELEILDTDLFEPDEMEEIIKREGKERLEEMIKAGKICRATARIVARYLGTSLLNISEELLLQEYHEPLM